MLKRKNNTGKKIAIGAAVSGVVGYLAGLLTAPASGKETRHEIAEKAGDVKTEAEQQLEKLHDELDDLIKDAKVKTIALGSAAREEFNETVVAARDAQDKAAHVLKAVRAGKADDPELNKALKQAKQASKNLAKYFKS